jgi:hypothetical protein
MIPVSVVERLLTALFAAGVLTAFPDDKGVLEGLGLVCVAPIVFPEEPRFRALDVLGPVEPPVPLTELPLEREPPAPVEAPLDICAEVGDVSAKTQKIMPIADNFISFSLGACD